METNFVGKYEVTQTSTTTGTVKRIGQERAYNWAYECGEVVAYGAGSKRVKIKTAMNEEVREFIEKAIRTYTLYLNDVMGEVGNNAKYQFVTMEEVDNALCRFKFDWSSAQVFENGEFVKEVNK